MKKILTVLFCLVPLFVFGQYVKIPSHYNAETTANHIMMGHIKTFLNDSTTEFVVEKKNNRWVTSFYDKNTISKKVWEVLQKGKSQFTGSTNGGYRFYITVWDKNDDMKILNSLDITIDAFTQHIKYIEVKL